MYLKTLHGCERATYFSFTRVVGLLLCKDPTDGGGVSYNYSLYYSFSVSSSNPQDQNGLPIHTHVTIIKN